MSLTEILKDAPPQDLGPACSVAATLKALPADEAEALRTALADDRWRATQLARVLASEGVHISAHTLSRHRRGECKCTRLGEP